MKNTFGTSVSMTVFGESHGAAVGAVIDGLCPGIAVDEDKIALALSKRRPSGCTETARVEKDAFQILSGVFNGRTTGTPICIIVPNTNQRSADYQYGECRPSHADFAASEKYHGFEDYRGGGHFSGRVTAAIVASGAILSAALENIGIITGTHILSLGGLSDRAFGNIKDDIATLKNAELPVLDGKAGEQMRLAIECAKADGDSIGGTTQTCISGIPAGVGEPVFDSMEGVLSHALFAIGGIKGVEFGGGFAACCGRGSEYNDALRYENGAVRTLSNNDGGINGGITNGMPIVFQCAVKPTPSIALSQQSVNITTKTNIDTEIKGRHDAAIIRRICPVIDSVTALAVCDMLAQRYGTDVFLRGIK